MVLKVGIIKNYNNNIKVATGTMKPCKNYINSLVHKSPPLMQGESVKTKRLKTVFTALTAKEPTPSTQIAPTPNSTVPDVPLGAETMTHDSVKYVLVVGLWALIG